MCVSLTTSATSPRFTVAREWTKFTWVPKTVTLIRDTQKVSTGLDG